jgi:hypothetical protein
MASCLTTGIMARAEGFVHDGAACSGRQKQTRSSSGRQEGSWLRAISQTLQLWSRVRPRAKHATFSGILLCPLCRDGVGGGLSGPWRDGVGAEP